MTFLESLVLLLLAAVVLLQVSRRVSIPYPSMLALAGVGVALLPGAPQMRIEPDTALALFIAPALLDSAFDFPARTALRFWAPLVVLAVGGVLVTAALVGWAAVALAGMPVAAALVLGAIVAPPDAAAATAVLSALAIPRSTEAVLRGESLFNDATALLLFGAALAVQTAGGLTPAVALHLGLAAPGGVLFGMAAAWIAARINRVVTGTLGGNILQFVNTLLVWIVASQLGLSAVLAIVAFAMTIANDSGVRFSARMRVHSYAVWSAVVFVLNVLGFLLMGMQARRILGAMSRQDLRAALMFAALVVVIVVAARAGLVIGFNRVLALIARLRGRPQPVSLRQSVLASWCGMRGLITLATAFALPASFPHRDLAVLAAFSVVIATLVIQGLTLAPLIRLLGLDRRDDSARELAAVRGELANAALQALESEAREEAEPLRAIYRLEHRALVEIDAGDGLVAYREIARTAVLAQRDALEAVRAAHRINADEYNALLEDIDWRDLTVLPDDGRRIAET